MTERFRHIALMMLMAVLAVGCANEEYVGDKALQELNEKGKPVSFDLIAAPQTRALRTGAEAADDLNGSFVVYVRKNYASAPSQVVFDNYFVVWGDNSANTTTSNSAGWEYVGYYSLPAVGTSGNTGFPELKPATAPANRNEQFIKYWDFSANKYDFLAYSLGKGVTSGTTTYADASAMRYDATDGYTYDLSGTTAQLAACYISDLEKKDDQSASNSQVQLTFRKLGARVRIALYETIPGYSVKDVKFYQSASAESSGTTAYLYGAAESMPNEGTFTVTFNNDGKPVLDWTKKTGTTDLTYISFGDAVTTEGTTWTGWATRDYQETADPDEAVYIGRSSNHATGPANFVTVLPNPDPQPLNLKVDYTLLTRDGFGETIDVKGATAVVPAQYAAWQPNCSYTYIFKISDNTNGQIGTDSPVGLFPVTLDAVVNVDAEGYQETVTTVTNPSITTYQEGSDFATYNAYKAGAIYIMVNNGEELTVGTNANLYRAEVTGMYPNVTESSVANALATGKNPATGTDDNGNTMTITRVENSDSDELSTLDNNSKAVFTATTGTTYVFEYIDERNDRYYKVIKVMVE